MMINEVSLAPGKVEVIAAGLRNQSELIQQLVRAIECDRLETSALRYRLGEIEAQWKKLRSAL